MISTIRRTFILAGLLWLFIAGKGYATHQLGNEIGYVNVSPGVYVVSLKFYRDCSGIGAATSYTLAAKAPGCNAGRTFTLNRVGNPVIGNLYCASFPATCTSTSQPNYEEFLFTTTVTFTASEQTCSDWTLSINFIDGNRPATANVVGTPILFAEAFLKLGANINNSSPKFNERNVPVPLVNAGKPVTIAFTASDPDGDSLSYKLVESLVAPNMPVPYNTYDLSAQEARVTNPANPAQFALIPQTGAFSAKFPLHSYKVNWNGAGPYQAERYFELDSITGKLSFTPIFYNSNNASANGANKYNMAVRVSEYRKINGTMVMVGFVTRDILVTLVNSGQNRNPLVAGIKVNNLPVNLPAPILVAPAGSPISISVNTADPDAADNLEVVSNADSVMAGAVVSVSSGPQPVTTISWTPTPSQIRSQPYYFNVIVKDNACPAKGYHSETIGVRVTTAGGVTGTKEDRSFSANFIAFPNPFTQDVSFRFSRKDGEQTILIYNSLGREVDRIRVSATNGETSEVRWQGAEKFAAGAYIARLISADRSIQTIQFTKVQ